MAESDYIVIRGEGLPGGLDGRWFDRSTALPAHAPTDTPTGSFVATGEFEVRDSDGAVAEVYRWVPDYPPESVGGSTP